VTGSEWAATLSPDRGRRGSIVHLSLFAPGVEAASDVAVTGMGVIVRRNVYAGPGRLDLVLTITADAPLGWRDIELSFGAERRRLPFAFEILELASSGGWSVSRGIGGHLI
jgi:hypothetical protein